MQNSVNKCVLLFVKDTSGCAKTRLAAHIGPAAATELYKCFLFDLLEMFDKLGIPLEIAFYPPPSETRLKSVLGDSHYYFSQQGGDLGQRMKNAFESAFGRGHEKVVLLGSDSPDLPDEFIKNAFSLLETSDAVVGPAADGGYYLVGFSRNSFAAAAFENISWSSEKVLEQTLCALKNLNKNVSLLPTWHDIDTIDDLRLFALRNRSGTTVAFHTLSYISKEIPYV
jgi:uncharacterized protein